jgi:peptidoglycan/LPS O-acetylase OafA/YrhL
MTNAVDEPLTSTMPSNSAHRRVSSLDGVRAFAALGVVVYHCAGYLGLYESADGVSRYVFAFIHNLGNFGVAVFFVLSGYLIFREFVRKILFDGKRTPLPHYFERRFLRIYPAYWLAMVGLVIVVGAPSVAGGAFGLLTLTERHFSSAVFPGLAAAWTLYVEVAFYVFVPVFAGVLWLLCRKRDVKVRLAIVLAALVGLVVFAHIWIGVVVPAVAPEYQVRLRMNLPTYFGWFSAGMGLGVASVWAGENRSLPRSLRQLSGRPVVCWGVALVAYLAVVLVEKNFQFGSETAIETPLMFQVRIFLQGISAFFFVLPFALVNRPSRMRSLVGSRPLAWFGGISYGVYLWHQIIIRQLNKWMTFDPNVYGFLWMTGIVMMSAILIGWISFRLIEKPALSLAR